ncbi:hypothetical protein N7488_008940 [Penicillium malachiteum]|nr:hypothetical protein N7488_008940 [Penicillium malachiteum]
MSYQAQDKQGDKRGGSHVQASTNIAPAGSVQRTSEADNRTRAPVCKKRPGHVEAVGSAPCSIHLPTSGLVCYNQTDRSTLISNMFALPEIVYSVSLIFSPHILLFIILFYVHAFEAPHLTSIEDLRRLLVKGG